LFYYKIAFTSSNDFPDDWRIVFEFKNVNIADSEGDSKFYFSAEAIDLKGYETSIEGGKSILQLFNLKEYPAGTNFELRIYLNTTNDITSNVEVKIDIFYDRSGTTSTGKRIEKIDSTVCTRPNIGTVSKGTALAATQFRVFDEISLSEEVSRVGYTGPLTFTF
jgi:hypothetical protein